MAEFWTGYLLPFLLILGKILLFVVPLLVAVAYLTYAERKIISAVQMRIGPNVVGPFGLLQPFADAVKLLFKETVLPTGSSPIVFFLAPMVTFSLAMIAWAVSSAIMMKMTMAAMAEPNGQSRAVRNWS